MTSMLSKKEVINNFPYFIAFRITIVFSESGSLLVKRINSRKLSTYIIDITIMHENVH